MDQSVPLEGTYRFADFTLDPGRRALRHGELPVELPDRLFDALLCLVRNRGRLVERDELQRFIWGGRQVNDGSLHRAMSSLRKALRDAGADQELITTAPTRGYRFVAAVEVMGQAPDATPADPPTSAPPTGRRNRPRAGIVLGLAALCLGAAWVATVQWRRPPDAAAVQDWAHQPRSIAVLDFSDDSSDPRQGYVARGLADELAGLLGRLSTLHVAARTSARFFADKNAPAQDIARQLGVTSLLEGSVRQDGTHLRVNVQLIDGRTGFQIWSQRYDRTAADALDLQASIAEAVVGALKLTLVGNDMAALSIGGTRDAAAFDAYLRGINAMKDRASASAVANAIADFDEALKQDPAYSMALVMRARALVYARLDDTSPDQAAAQNLLSRARADAERSVALTPRLGMAHSTLGYVMKYSLADFARAKTEFAAGVEFAPNDAAVISSYGFFELALGNIAEGTIAAEKAAALDPLSPVTYRMLGAAYILAHRYDDADAAFRRARLLEPAPTEEDRVYAWTVALRRGDPATAARICAGETSIRDQFCLAVALHALGRTAEAQRHMDRLQAAFGDSGAFQYAQIDAQWGQLDAAGTWLRTAYRLRDPGLVYIKAEPMLDPIRNSTAYLDIAGRLGSGDGGGEKP
jgi:TolB-like protein/DNA-binding winged helix-turn-helix (wHTH) protein/Tfp pilus assembly protein PilF